MLSADIDNLPLGGALGAADHQRSKHEKETRKKGECLDKTSTQTLQQLQYSLFKIKNVVSPAPIIQNANTRSDIICFIAKNCSLIFIC